MFKKEVEMLLTIIFLIYFGIGLFLSSCVDRSFGINFATVLVCVAYFTFWPILIVIIIGNAMGKKIYDEEKKENEDS